MAEDKKPSKAEGRYGKSEKKPMAKNKPAEKKEEPAEDAADDKPAGDGKNAMMEMMKKRQLQEFRDLHGQHRDALKDLHDRHQAEMKGVMDQMTSTQANGQDGAPDAGAAPAGAQETAAA